MNYKLFDETHVANMTKLANYLLMLPAGYDRFDMNVFCENVATEVMYMPRDVNAALLNDSNVIADAVGHGPVAGVPPEEVESWEQYSERCFVPDSWLGGDPDAGNYNVWQYLFDPIWNDWDYGHRAVAMRLLRIAGAVEVGVDIPEKLLWRDENASQAGIAAISDAEARPAR